MKRLLFAILLLGAVPALFAADNSRPKFPDLVLQGSSGGEVQLSQLRGNVVLLNFWATWCGPCRMELPKLQDLYNRYSDRKFVVLPINIDEDRRRIAPFLKAMRLSLPVYFADPYATAAFTSRGIPTSFIIAPDGTLDRAYIGYEPDIETHWKEQVEKFFPRKKAR